MLLTCFRFFKWNMLVPHTKCEMLKFKCAWNVSKIGLVLKVLGSRVQIYKIFQIQNYGLKDKNVFSLLTCNKVYRFICKGERRG